jgi:glucokinase
MNIFPSLSIVKPCKQILLHRIGFIVMYRLVADIGGTTSRFAVTRIGSLELEEALKYPNKDFSSLGDVIAQYLSDIGEIKPSQACLAVAGPAHGEHIQLTNIDWKFSVSDYKQRFGLERLLLTNDFTALAMSVPFLEAKSIQQIGSGKAVEKMPISVLGPGTGLGVSGLLWNGTGWTALQGEGGNVNFTATTEEEIELLRIAQKELGYVRAEDFISGRGLTYLHDIRLEMHGKARVKLKAEDIAWRAKTENSGFYKDTLMLFCGMLGSFAGNQALTLGAFGGVYIGGGVAPQLEELFHESPFRARFEARGVFTDYIKQIPTFLMLSHSRNALVGAAAMLS